MKDLAKVLEKGTPLYVKPHAEPKVWGINGVGEYWYGAEPGDKSSLASAGDISFSLSEAVDAFPEMILGKEVIKNFGRMLPLTKVLTPKGRLSVQFHDAKNELWVVTGIDHDMFPGAPCIIIGFRPDKIREYGEDVKKEYENALKVYGDALNELIAVMKQEGFEAVLDELKDVAAAAVKVKDDNEKISALLKSLEEARAALDDFYNYVEVHIGDVIPVPQGTLHALGAGIEVVEPQISGPTQSLEDGSTYPVRYYFPGYPAPGAGKELDISRIGEMSASLWEPQTPATLISEEDIRIERLPGGFEKKGMEVNRVSVAAGSDLEYKGIRSYHMLVAVSGEALVLIKGKEYSIPRAEAGGEMVLIPACAEDFTIKASEDSLIIDTFTPVV